LAAVPDPPARLELEVEIWPAGTPIVRVFSAAHGPLSFNALPGFARFRPVFGPEGRIVSTLYGAAETDAAFAETVLHDLSSAGRRTVPFSRIERRAIATLKPLRDLRLAALHGYGLRRAGVRRTQLIDTPPSSYPQTAKWGQAIYDHPERVDGIVWMSRQFDSRRALLLWAGADRVAADEIELVAGSVLALLAGEGYELAAQAALRAGFVRINRD
jgi:hypothetical protein